MHSISAPIGHPDDWTLADVSDASIVALNGGGGGRAAVIALQRRIVRALDMGHRRIVVDLAAATRLGDEEVTLLCGALRFLRRCDATLATASCPSHVRRALELFGLRDLEFHPTVDAALRRATSPTIPMSTGAP